MPILKPEADFYPEHLFDTPLDEQPWWVVHLRSRQEKLAAREALLRKVPYYLPQREQRMMSGGRNRISYLPLFPGYLFFRGGIEERLEMLKTNLCVRLLEVLDQAAIHEDLLQIRKLQETKLPLIPHPELTEGDPVRIMEGPFKGYLGVIEKRRGHFRLIVAVRFIHRFVSVELPWDLISPVKDPAEANRLLEKMPKPASD
ncbi:MAG: antitermination protein NusG [Acidobacteria bacterium]|nr:antitermination protein NusG [Acidobacteriota bacterium]MCG3191329.1 Transcription antitermination protein RfaH [Thermoanaerobaculia bacterium]MCK6683172.1 antitermination protein NusG [Thermoanaerobaculia bacterium]